MSFWPMTDFRSRRPCRPPCQDQLVPPGAQRGLAASASRLPSGKMTENHWRHCRRRRAQQSRRHRLRLRGVDLFERAGM